MRYVAEVINHTKTSKNGNFLKAIEIIARFCSVMEEHVCGTQKAEKSHAAHVTPSYLRNRIQNELIHATGSKIRNTILDLIRKNKHYSTIFDRTPDISHTEEMIVIIRLVNLNESTTTVELHEHFIQYCSTTYSTKKTDLQIGAQYLNLPTGGQMSRHGPVHISKVR